MSEALASYTEQGADGQQSRIMLASLRRRSVVTLQVGAKLGTRRIKTPVSSLLRYLAKSCLPVKSFMHAPTYRRGSRDALSRTLVDAWASGHLTRPNMLDVAVRKRQTRCQPSSLCLRKQGASWFPI